MAKTKKEKPLSIDDRVKALEDQNDRTIEHLKEHGIHLPTVDPEETEEEPEAAVDPATQGWPGV